jgi:transcriptional regulator with XRE-family HTH domain
LAICQRARRPQQRLGDYIGRLRIRRGLSQREVVCRLCGILGDAAPEDGCLSETWYKRIEQGRTVKISRVTIAALTEVLCTTPQERAGIWLAADRNVTISLAATPSVADEVLNFVCYTLHTEAREMLSTLLEDRRTVALDRRDMLGIVQDVLAIMLWDVDNAMSASLEEYDDKAIAT